MAPWYTARHALTGWIFLRALGFVYLVAFASLWSQIHGLVGARGILPVGEFLERVGAQLGADGPLRLPTLLWIDASDAALHGLCALGVVLSGVLMLGAAPIPVLIMLWALYLSLALGGQTFLSFQWDTLLLETGFLALFLAPARLRPRFPRNEQEPSRFGIWLLRFLLFKLMFLSGAVKLLSMDATWWELTALDFHYYTQPLPLWTSWYAHHLPSWIQRVCVFAMFVIELVLPFAIFFGRRARLLAGAALVLLQIAIAATGNYGFFNLLTVVLCLILLDDRAWSRVVPDVVGDRTSAGGAPVRAAAFALLMLASSLVLVQEMVRTAPQELAAAERYLLSWGRPYVLRPISPFRTINGYGLFRAMTTARPEIVVEGSYDGRQWREYAFRFKPGDPARGPRLAAPHMPRLDWQMWFAALNPRGARVWLTGLMRCLLEGEENVVALLDGNPFADGPPRFVRLVSYRYRFAEPGEDGWWIRSDRRDLTGPVETAAGKTKRASPRPSGLEMEPQTQ